MLGNRVRVIRDGGNVVEGTMTARNASGVTLYQHSAIADYQNTIYIPYVRIIEIVDLGRAA